MRPAQTSRIHSLAASATHLAVACGSGEVRLFLPGSLAPTAVLAAAPQDCPTAAPALACAFGPIAGSGAGGELFTTYADGTVRSWDLADLGANSVATLLGRFHRWLSWLFCGVG